MTSELAALTATAAFIGFFHTLTGPDHYLPFVVIAKARRWSIFKTVWMTIICGIGHVGSSVVLGGIGIALGVAVWKLQGAESLRGNIAAWLLTAFGLVYFAWGLRRAIRNRPHTHLHLHNAGEHGHEHIHEDGHVHVHEQAVGDGKASLRSLTPWILFTVFVFGPCEPLIPILMYPAAAKSTIGMVTVSAVFAAVTISTMLAVVLAATFGLNLLPMRKLDRYSHAMAGGSIAICGMAIIFLGL